VKAAARRFRALRSNLPLLNWLGVIHVLVDGSPVSEVTLRRHDGYFIVLRAYREPVAIPESQLAETLTNWLCGNRQCTVTLVECPPDAPCRRIQL